MNLTEILMVLFIFGIVLTIIGINVNAISRSSNIMFSKIRLDCFLEEARYRAINSSKRITIYYQRDKDRFVTSEGTELNGFLGSSSDNVIFGFSGTGAFFVVSGSTTFYFEDNSKLTILPVTGQLRY
jgi:Tfp pilus assembly protein FimT